MRKIRGKFIAILVCVCMLACQFPHVYAESDWIEIASVEEFLDFAENCRLDSGGEMVYNQS